MGRNILGGIVLTLIATAFAGADTLQWNGNSSAFDNPANWDPNQIPTLADDLRFNRTPTIQTVFFGAGAEAGSMSFTSGNYSLLGIGAADLDVNDFVSINVATVVSDGSNTVLEIGGDTAVGGLAAGTLNLINSSYYATDTLNIGVTASGSGIVNVHGNGTTLSVYGSDGAGRSLFIGRAGVGAMNVTSGGQVTIGANANFTLGYIAGSDGTLLVDGAGSVAEIEDLIVGEAGSGSVTISNGGRIDSTRGTNREGIVGRYLNSSGTVQVTGDGSNWKMGLATVGREGSGNVVVNSGGRMEVTGDLNVGSFATGEGELTVSGAGVNDVSRVDVSGSFRAGWDGLGVVNVEAGAAMNVETTAYVGYSASNQLENVLNVDGAGTTFETNGSLYAGLDGKGEINITNGATVASNLGRVGHHGTSVGSVDVDGRGSRWDMAHNLYLGLIGDGTMTVTDGGRVMTENEVGLGGRGDATGRLTVSGVNDNGTSADISDDLRSELIINNGELHVGGEPAAAQTGGIGDLKILDGGRIEIENHAYTANKPNSQGRVVISGVNANGMQSEFDVSDSGGSTANDFTRIGSTSGRARVEVLDGGRMDNERLLIRNEPADPSAFGDTGTYSETMLISGTHDPGTPGDPSDDIPSIVTVTDGIQIGDIGRAANVRIEQGGRLVTVDESVRSSIGQHADSDGSGVTIDGAGSNWTHTGILGVGGSGGDAANPSLLQIENGGSFNASSGVFIGDSIGSFGKVLVQGPGSRMDVVDYVLVGDQSQGELEINDGGVVEARVVQIGGNGGGTGTATVTGGSSRLVTTEVTALGDRNAGGAAIGTLTVSQGGLVQTGTEAQIGSRTNGSGTVTLSTGGTWTSGSMYVGGRSDAAGGSGELNILDGGIVDVADEFKVWGSGNVTLDGGANGRLEMASFVRSIGSTFQFTSGELAFRNNAANSRLLDTAALTDIFNGDSTLNAGQHVSFAGPVELTAPLRMNGGDLSIHSATFGTKASFQANLDWDAGTLAVTGEDLTIGSDGLLGDVVNLVPGQQLEVTGGGLANAGQLNLIGTKARFTGAASINMAGASISAIDATLEFAPGITNDGEFQMIDTTVNGSITNGSSGSLALVGSNDVFGDLTMGAADRLFLGLAGVANGEFDTLDIAGDATLAGLLQVNLQSNFDLTVGDEFEVVNIGGTTTGMFSGLQEGDLVGQFDGVDLFITYLGGDGNDVSLFTSTAVNVCDFDGDGVCTCADVDALVAAIASGSGDSSFDLTGDGNVDQADLTEWLAEAGSQNLASGASYLLADANLDGTVDVSDLNIWSSNKFTSNASWCSGDFNADGIVDISDLNIWSSNKFTSADSNGLAPVPEPNLGWPMMLLLIVGSLHIRRKRE